MKGQFNLAVFAFLALGLVSFQAQAGVLNDVAPLKDAELAQMCGGFTLSNGISLNVGIDNAISLNGATVATSSIVLNGNNVSTSSSGVTTVNGNGGVTTVDMSSVNTAIITNTASNVSLNQTRTITVDLSNVSHQQLQAVTSIAAIQSQALNGLKSGLH